MNPTTPASGTAPQQPNEAVGGPAAQPLNPRAELLARARRGDADCLQELDQLLDAEPELWRQ